MSLPTLDVLLLAAHPLELAPFAQALGPNLRGMLHGRSVAAAKVGVGMPAAGGGAAVALAQFRPSSAVLVGSYGAYPGGTGFVPGQLIVPPHFVATDLTVLSARAAIPSAMPDRAEADPELAAALAAAAPNCERAAIATTLGITTDDALAATLGERSGCRGENLEALAVALACQATGVRFAAVLACTNLVGAQGRAQWLRNARSAAEAAAQAVLTWLQR